MSASNLAAVYRQLSVLSSAGITPAASFELLALQERGAGKRRFQQMTERLWKGERISQVMKGLPGLFPASHCMLVVEGETTGRLDQTLVRLAEMTEHSMELQRMMAAELRLPTITMFVALPLVIFLMPMIAGPGVVAFAWALVGAFSFLVILSHMAINLPGKGRAWATKVARGVPNLGTIAKNMTLGYFARSFSMLFAAGVPISPALRCAADATGDDKIVRAAKQVVACLDRGESIVESLGATGLFPRYLLSMVNAGEATGNIDKLMEAAATIYEEDANTSLHVFAQWLGATSYMIAALLTFLIAAFFYSHMV